MHVHDHSSFHHQSCSGRQRERILYIVFRAGKAREAICNISGAVSFCDCKEPASRTTSRTTVTPSWSTTSTPMGRRTGFSVAAAEMAEKAQKAMPRQVVFILDDDGVF